MLEPDPQRRPSAAELLHHPFVWRHSIGILTMPMLPTHHRDRRLIEQTSQKPSFSAQVSMACWHAKLSQCMSIGLCLACNGIVHL